MNFNSRFFDAIDRRSYVFIFGPSLPYRHNILRLYGRARVIRLYSAAASPIQDMSD